MDSRKVLKETLEMLKKCQSNCDYIALSTNGGNNKRLYNLASKNIKAAYNTLQDISHKSSNNSKDDGKTNSLHQSIKNNRIAHHIQEVTSISVVDSNDVLRPGEIPEL